MKVNLFIPCFIDQLYPETAFNVVKLLQKCGMDVRYNSNQTCCGQPSFNSGYWKETKTLAKKFIKDFNNGNVIVGPSASCLGFVRNYYAEILKDSDSLDDFRQMKPQLFELTDFIVNQLGVTDFGAEFRAKITYHDACSALREYGIKEEPRKLLSKVKGLELIEMNESDVCCGFGGTFSVKHKSISSAMVEQKVQNAIASGADYIMSTESSCLLNMEAYIKKNNIVIKTIHIADIIASGWE